MFTGTKRIELEINFSGAVSSKPLRLAIWKAWMPRFFDSDDPHARLEFTENVECPSCGELFEGLFYDYTESLSVQDMTEAPRGEHQCPACGFFFISEFSGWTFYTEAG